MTGSEVVPEALQAEGLDDLIALFGTLRPTAHACRPFRRCSGRNGGTQPAALSPSPTNCRVPLNSSWPLAKPGNGRARTAGGPADSGQDLLAAAWQRLEAEERKLLSQRGERKPVTVRNPEITGSSPASGANGEVEVPKAAAANNEVMMLRSTNNSDVKMQKHTQRGRR